MDTPLRSVDTLLTLCSPPSYKLHSNLEALQTDLGLSLAFLRAVRSHSKLTFLASKSKECCLIQFPFQHFKMLFMHMLLIKDNDV